MRFTRDPQRAEDVVQEVARAGDELDRAVEAWQVAAALARLTPEHRQVLVQAHWLGRSVAETATVPGLPPGTVKSRTYYAVRALKLVLEEMGGLVTYEERRSLASYVLGALSPADRRQLDNHLLGCADCREELASYAGLPGLLSRLDLAEATGGTLLAPPCCRSRVRQGLRGSGQGEEQLLELGRVDL